jgi:hypothetical protein
MRTSPGWVTDSILSPLTDLIIIMDAAVPRREEDAAV